MTPVTEPQPGTPPKRRLRRIVRGAGFGLAVLIAGLGIGGSLWNSLAISYYRHAYRFPGKIYSVEGLPVHMYCTGSGSPAVILNSGLGDDFTAWAKVQPELSKITQVCSFDRSGLGWSDEQSPDHDANTLADQLHALLKVAGIAKPFILMGHSIAGVYDRAYATRYPDDLAGLIFVDAATPGQRQRFDAIFGPPDPPHYTLRKWANFLGISRAKGACSKVPPGLEFERGFIYANHCKTSVMDGISAEEKAIDRSSDETLHSGPFGALPILIFSEDPENMARLASDTHTPAQMKQGAALWNSMQEDLKRLSSNSRRIIAKGSSHLVQVDRADLVNREVSVFIEQIRSGQVSPDNGTTKTE
jgi:pimeloyl-ACP methyl ester carboxylesterase